MNINDLTLGEIEQIEQAARASVSQLEDPKAPKGRLMAAIAFVITRRDNPAFTWEQAQQLTLAQVTDLITDAKDDSVDPTSPSRPTG